METHKIRSKMEAWLADYLVQSGMNGYVVGVSGGIDSAVCAKVGSIAASKVGKTMTALSLPISYNGRVDGGDMSGFCVANDIESVEFDLSALYQTGIQLLQVDDPVIRSNVRTRLRSMALYTFANARKLLVIGTMNRTEFGIGYFQKHAALGDVLPLAKLSKSEIRELGAGYGFSNELIHRKASGCVHFQTAESEWGIPEEALDKMINREWAVVEGINVDPTKLNLARRLNQLTAHKRTYPPTFSPE